MKQTRRQYYAPKIAAKISEMKAEGKTVEEMKKILCDMNPGQYGHMRKTWANEYMIQLGLSKRNKSFIQEDKNQQNLF